MAPGAGMMPSLRLKMARACPICSWIKARLINFWRYNFNRTGWPMPAQMPGFQSICGYNPATITAIISYPHSWRTVCDGTTKG